MSSGDRHPTALALRLYLIVSAVTALVAAGVALKHASAGPTRVPPPIAVNLITPPDVPIPAEAQVFRTAIRMLAIEPAARTVRSAHPRTLATARFLRAFPGSPPRIPHPLTAEEFRTDGCRTCHERGGYSTRFSAYVPLTPHPERGICLQCHVGVDSVVGTADPGADPNSRCSLCHAANGGPPQPGASLTWATTVWPVLPRVTPDQSPPPIPHDLQFRENCVACHSGPAAVMEVRTKHAVRANCRQCHVALGVETEAFARHDSVVATRGAP